MAKAEQGEAGHAGGGAKRRAFSMNCPCGFAVSRIESLCSPACRKRRLVEASRGLPAEAIPSVVKV